MENVTEAWVVLAAGAGIGGGDSCESAETEEAAKSRGSASTLVVRTSTCRYSIVPKVGTLSLLGLLAKIKV